MMEDHHQDKKVDEEGGEVKWASFEPYEELGKYLDDSSLCPVGRPNFVLLMGGPGCGKTTLRRREYAKGYVNLDAGEIFNELAKGADLDFPGELEVPMDLMGRIIAKAAIKQGRNIVVEIIGDSFEDADSMIRAMIGAGYEIKFIHVTCDFKLAYDRHLRAVETDPTYVSAHFTQAFHHRWIMDAATDKADEKISEN